MILRHDDEGFWFTIKCQTIYPFIQRSTPEVLLGKGFLKICSKFTGEHPCRSVISIKLLKQPY